MDSNRRSVRHLEPTDDSRRTSTVDSFRASTVDSGRGSMTASERPSTLDIITPTDALSSLSTDTPLAGDDDTVHQECQNDEPVRIRCTPVLGNRCYEQAYVSYVDHPSAFFLQIAHFQQQYEKLHQEINEFYSKNPITNPSSSWKRGDYCIAKYKDDVFYRARIVEVPEVTKMENIYDVVFLDFGNWDKVASIDIHPLQSKFAILTAQAIPCSLTKTLPRTKTWFDNPKAITFFEDLVLEKYVDATFYLKSSRDYWQLNFVDLVLSSSKLNIRECMKKENFIREVSNDEIYIECNPLLKPVDYIIYSIPHDDEAHNDD